LARAVILWEGGGVRAADLPARVRERGGAAPEAAPDARPADEPIATLADVERRHIETVLARMEGHRERTARALGIATKTLYRKLREYETSDGHTSK
jgi:DNA-binding NtrC family response regulator